MYLGGSCVKHASCDRESVRDSLVTCARRSCVSPPSFRSRFVLWRAMKKRNENKDWRALTHSFRASHGVVLVLFWSLEVREIQQKSLPPLLSLIIILCLQNCDMLRCSKTWPAFHLALLRFRLGAEINVRQICRMRSPAFFLKTEQSKLMCLQDTM